MKKPTLSLTSKKKVQKVLYPFIIYLFRQKEELELFEHTTRIISFIKSLPDTQIAIASRTHAPEW